MFPVVCAQACDELVGDHESEILDVFAAGKKGKKGVKTLGYAEGARYTGGGEDMEGA